MQLGREATLHYGVPKHTNKALLLASLLKIVIKLEDLCCFTIYSLNLRFKHLTVY